jgi:hypothetical protein
VTCECGCGYEGEDPVGQYLLEEALLEMLDAIKLAVAEEEEREYERQQLINQTHELVNKEMGR